MRNIVVITDSIHSLMIKKSLKQDVNIVLFLEIDNFYSLEENQREELQLSVINAIQQVVQEQYDEIDYFFSFVMNMGLRWEKFDLSEWVLKMLEICLEGKEKGKIIDGSRIYHSMYSTEGFARRLDNPKITSLDGLVFGISHGETGIRSKYLPGTVCNFASSSQDIFFNYMTAQKIWDNYALKVQSVHYVVIEMFDYTYFNFETMVTGAMIDCLKRNGLACPQEYDLLDNKKTGLTSTEINKYLKSVWYHATEKEKGILDNYFENMIQNDENAYCDYPLEERERKLTRKEILDYLKSPRVVSVQKEVFEKSIEKNIKYFCDFLSFLYKKNPEMEIYLCLIPKYIEVEKFEKKNFSFWKEHFENIIYAIKERFPIIYLNYKEDKSISGNSDFYWDITHLNYDGSVYFSKMLAQQIKWKPNE